MSSSKPDSIVSAERTSLFRFTARNVCGIGDNESITFVCFCMSRIQVGCFAHGQAWKISDFTSAITGSGYSEGKGTDCVGLVDDYEYGAMLLKLVENAC